MSYSGGIQELYAIAREAVFGYCQTMKEVVANTLEVESWTWYPEFGSQSDSELWTWVRVNFLGWVFSIGVHFRDNPTLLLCAVLSMVVPWVAWRMFRLLFHSSSTVSYSSRRTLPTVWESRARAGASSARKKDDYARRCLAASEGERSGEASRWYQQAEYDLQSARNDLYASEISPEWVCYKCQQAAEKALKCVLIATRPTRIDLDGHDLCTLAEATKDKDLIRLAKNLQGTVGLTSRMRYPDMLPFPQVPRDVFTENQATNAADIAKALLTYVEVTYVEDYT